MPINKFYVNFATSFGPFKPTKGIKRNQRYAHRFPQFNLKFWPMSPLATWVLHCQYGPGTVLSFSEDQHEGGPSYGMMPTHTQPAV